MTVRINSKDLKGMADYFRTYPEIAEKAASLAINDVARGTGMTMLRKEMYAEIDFPKGYIDKTRLGVKQTASPTRLEARVEGRDRPTSLARFAKGGQTPKNTRNKGVVVKVKRGKTTTLKKSWLINLKNGNLGLAVRLKVGEKLNNKTTEDYTRLAPNVYLLYGPSVNQVFSGVAQDHSGEVAQMVMVQFFRQFRRLSNG
jgi:hypothetical protein